MRFAAVPGFFLALIVTGCSLSPTVSPSPSLSQNGGLAIHGKAYGGQQPVAGAHVYLYAAGTGGYGTAATSLLNSASNTTADGSSNYYVITDTNGAFSISSDYTCTTGTGVYLYAVGGNSGSGANSAIGLMAALGACPVADNFASATPFVFMDEVSTIAAAYAMAGFATDATHVSSSGTTLAATGVQNAFANAANLASISTGQALTTTPAGNGTVPQTEINTLANILASCINTGSSSSTACSTLFSNAMSAGSSGTTATDTATAAIYMAHNPGSNITALYDLGTPTPPFAPALGSQPNDFTIAINFTGGGLNMPQGIAIDGSGNAWVPNLSGNSVTELTSAGAAVSGSSGFTGGGLSYPWGIAIDGSGNVWATNTGNNSVTELNSSGGAVSGSSGYTGGGLSQPYGIAIDGSGNAWVANINGNSVTELNSSGGAVSGSSGFTGGGLSQPVWIAIDGSGNAWITNIAGNSVTELTSAGAAVSGSSGFTGGGMNNPYWIAIDGSGNAWVPNYAGNSVSELNSSGDAVSGSSGFSGGGLNYPYAIAIDGSGNVWVANYTGNTVTELNSSGGAVSGSLGFTGGGLYGGYGIAIDGSGNVWVANGNGSVSEFIGAATPVVTPIVAGLPATPTSNGSSNLGTRP
jgi:streptogramin lyase